MNESNGWGVFTVVCMILLVGLMEHQGMINLIDDKKNQQTEDEMTIGEPETSTADEMHPLGNYCLTDHSASMQMHIHPYLTIVIDGEEFEIPSNAGIDTDTCPSAMHMTHTHDNTGKLHVENYTIEEVPLEVFFDVWGMHFDETGIFNHRGGSVEMTVNGTISQDYQNHILGDQQNIVIIYTSA